VATASLPLLSSTGAADGTDGTWTCEMTHDAFNGIGFMKERAERLSPPKRKPIMAFVTKTSRTVQPRDSTKGCVYFMTLIATAFQCPQCGADGLWNFELHRMALAFVSALFDLTILGTHAFFLFGAQVCIASSCGTWRTKRKTAPIQTYPIL
jgi:predicted RNA-binding Zn-ribbon protein involved in translation (DUF1610 family)